MSRRIRNKRKTSSCTKSVVFLSDLPDSSIIMYPASGKMYAKTGRETATHFEAVCIASNQYNRTSLGRTLYLNKKGLKRARHLNQKHWDFDRNSLMYLTYDPDNPLHHIHTDRCRLWMAAVNLKETKSDRFYCRYYSYTDAIAASKYIKSKYPKSIPNSPPHVSNILNGLSVEFRHQPIEIRRGL